MSENISAVLFAQIGILAATIFMVCILVCLLLCIWDRREINIIGWSEDQVVQVAVVALDVYAGIHMVDNFQATGDDGQTDPATTASAPPMPDEVCPVDQVVYRGMADRARPVVGVEYVP